MSYTSQLMIRVIVMVLLAGSMTYSVAQGAPATFYVATNGNDAWSGTLPAPNAAGTDGPFATLTRARDTIRQLKANGDLDQPLKVLVRGGTYYLPETDTGVARFRHGQLPHHLYGLPPRAAGAQRRATCHGLEAISG